MQCYHLAYMAGASGADVVLSTKNIFGTRVGGRVQRDKIIWNSCGQIVISGGSMSPKDPNEIEAAQREYFEETGVNLHDDNVRAQMRCIGDPVLKIFRPDPRGFCCVYQMVSSSSPLVGIANRNIAASVPADDELHDCGTVPGGDAIELFGPPLLDGWRLAQYRLLSPVQKQIADRRMLDAFDWFVDAVKHLVGFVVPTSGTDEAPIG